MGAITLEEIAYTRAFLVGLGGSVGVIIRALNKAIKKAFEPVYTLLNKIEMDRRKDFLVQILSSADRGEKLTEMERIRLAENYGEYIAHDGNSYIKEWHERLKNEGKL